MMDALAMYKGVLYEIDKYQSADFDVDDFNYYIASAVDKWLKEELIQFELTQSVTDKISCLVKASDPLVLNGSSATNLRALTLPDDYRHLVSCLVKLGYKQATPMYALGADRSDYSKRFTGDNKANIMGNYYLMPLVTDSDVRLYHRATGNTLSFLFDTPVYPNSTVYIKDVTLEYLKKPSEIKLNADYTILVDTPFPAHANREIVKVCASLFLENSESPRLQTHEAINH